MAADAGLVMLAATQGIGLFQSFLPPLADIRKKNPETDPAFTADVRLGEVAAVSLTVGIGVISSGLTGSPLPAFVAVLVSVALVYMYETTLRAERPLERHTAREEQTLA